MHNRWLTPPVYIMSPLYNPLILCQDTFLQIQQKKSLLKVTEITREDVSSSLTYFSMGLEPIFSTLTYFIRFIRSNWIYLTTSIFLR